MPVDHYENFPVASLLLPAALRPAVESIYAFARSADDIADEGNAPDAARLAALDRYRAALDGIELGQTPSDALFRRLSSTIRAHGLSIDYFRALLDAFSQDVVCKRYADFAAVQDYCRRSADPVGRLMLQLYRRHDAELLSRSDAICTSLQLINFWQDVAMDWDKDRVYLPQDEMRQFGVSEQQIAAGDSNPAWRALLAFQVGRARAMMEYGAPLARALPGRIGWELRLVVAGGLRILDRIEAADYDVFHRRPQLGKIDYLAMLWRALRPMPDAPKPNNLD